MNNNKKIKYFAIVLVILVSFASGVYIGLTSPSHYKVKTLGEALNLLANKNKEVDFSLFNRVWQEIEEKYVDKPLDEKKMLYGALSGLVASLNDPYSTFLDPELSRTFLEEIKGSFEGIGAEIGIKNGELVVIAPLENSPAKRAGLKAKDKILKIDNVDTANISLDYAVSLIRGKKGTAVILTVKSEGEEEEKEIKIIRDRINIKSVKGRIIESEGNKIGYLKILSFTEDTDSLLKKTANDFVLRGVQGVIIDLRNNSGGYLETAIEVASEFMEDKIVLKEKYSGQVEDKVYYTKGKAALKDLPLVVIINGGSASASEILAGALKDYGLATIIGEKSYGKGSVQEYEQLPDGSSLKLTTAKWFTPKGNSIDNQGIEPDIKVELTEDDFNNDRDPQLDKAIEVLLEEIKGKN